MLDKGRPTVIMSYEDYISKMKNILSDDKYCILCRDPILKVEKITSTQNPALQGGHITQQLYDQLTPRCSDPPQMCQGKSTYVTSYLHYWIPHLPPCQGIGQNLNPTHRKKNTTEFVRMLKDVTIRPADQLVSFDVTSLFTQVPLDDALMMVSQKLTEDQTLQ